MSKEILFIFAEAIKQKRVILVSFIAKSGERIDRRCIPLDFSPSNQSKHLLYKYHVWDMHSIPNPHILSLAPEQIVHFELTEESFLPEKIITWTRKFPWTIIRNWGEHS